MILEKFLTILNNIKNIDFILFYGSLLGYVRENDFIKNDDDIDILINIFDVQSLLRQLKNLNLDVTVFIELKVDNTYGKIGIIQVLLPNNKETLDFYIYEI